MPNLCSPASETEWISEFSLCHSAGRHSSFIQRTPLCFYFNTAVVHVFCRSISSMLFLAVSIFVISRMGNWTSRGTWSHLYEMLCCHPCPGCHTVMRTVFSSDRCKYQQKTFRGAAEIVSPLRGSAWRSPWWFCSFHGFNARRRDQKPAGFQHATTHGPQSGSHSWAFVV